MVRKFTDRRYHVQDNADFEHQDAKIYCNTSQFPELLICGPYSKPHCARGVSKNYQLRFDPELGHFCIYINARQTLDIWYTVR